MNRLGIRRRLLLAVLVAVGLALAAMIVGFNLLLARNLSGNANDLLKARAAAELGRLEVSGNTLKVGEAPDDAALDTDVWIFSGQTALEEPARSPSVSAVARRLAASGDGFAEAPSQDVRLYAVPVISHGQRLGTVVTGVSLAPYEGTRRTALLASLALGCALLALVFFAARWLLSSALRPVARMTRQAAAWSEGDLDHRFTIGTPHDELTELAATLDGLLDRLSASLRREQSFSAELSHELRTPLSRLSAEVELALRRERTGEEYRAALESVQRNTQQLARTVDALLAAARHESAPAHGTADAFAVAEEVVETCNGLVAERALEVEVARPSAAVRIGVEAELAERVLQPVVENACRYGRSRVRITIARRDGAVVYSVDDDGQGVAEGERELIFEPGNRGHAGSQDTVGAGLGLALARRLARAAAGEIDAVTDDAGGHFLVRLPAG